MIPSLISFKGQGVQAPWDQTQQGIRMLKQLDGLPGDKNPAKDAVSIQTSQGQLDAVVFSNQDHSQTVVQRLRKPQGGFDIDWLEVPQQGNGIPNLSGFHVSNSLLGLHGFALGVRENYSASWLLPARTYGCDTLPDLTHSLARAEAVLSAYGF